jgi:hypothetical protein
LAGTVTKVSHVVCHHSILTNPACLLLMKTTMARDETLFDSVVGPSSHFKCSVHSSTVTLNTEKLCGVVVSFLGPLRSHSGTCGVRVVTKKTCGSLLLTTMAQFQSITTS